MRTKGGLGQYWTNENEMWSLELPGFFLRIQVKLTLVVSMSDRQLTQMWCLVFKWLNNRTSLPHVPERRFSFGQICSQCCVFLLLMRLDFFFSFILTPPHGRPSLAASLVRCLCWQFVFKSEIFVSICVEPFFAVVPHSTSHALGLRCLSHCLFFPPMKL